MGANLAWTSSSFYFTCGSTDASNTLTIKVAASNSRRAVLNVDNIFVNPVSV